MRVVTHAVAHAVDRDAQRGLDKVQYSGLGSRQYLRVFEVLARSSPFLVSRSLGSWAWWLR